MPLCKTCGGAASVPPPPFKPAPPVCEQAEVCVEIQNTDCVAYTGERLEYLDVDTGDRTTTILQKMNDAFAHVGEGMVTNLSTTSVEVSGEGTPAHPFRYRTILDDTLSENLLRNTRKGMVAVIDAREIKRILQVIAATPELRTLFCSICPSVTVPTAPAPVTACQTLVLETDGEAVRNREAGAPANLVMQTLRWTAPTPTATAADNLPVRLLYRAKNGTADFKSVTLSKTDTSYTIKDLLPNIVYQVRLENECSATSSTTSNTVETVFIASVAQPGLETGSSNLDATFFPLGGDIDKYVLEVSGGDLVTPRTAARTPPFPTDVPAFGYNFTGLTPGQTYTVLVTAYVGALSKRSVNVSQLLVTAPCATPTNVIAFISQ